VSKDFCKDSNVENVESRHLKDAQNVNQYGIAQGIARLGIGLNIK